MKRSHSEQTLRETFVILVAWFVMCCWTLGWCAASGYWTPTSETIETSFGLPNWVAYGIALPWIVSTAFTTWFCLSYMQDDEQPGQGDEHE